MFDSEIVISIAFYMVSLPKEDETRESYSLQLC